MEIQDGTPGWASARWHPPGGIPQVDQQPRDEEHEALGMSHLVYVQHMLEVGRVGIDHEQRGRPRIETTEPHRRKRTGETEPEERYPKNRARETAPEE